MGKVTIGDVAREAGVALGTVSNALNHPEKVRPETLNLVNAAIVKLGYAPNQSARLLAGGKNPTIGLVIPRLDHGLSLQVAHGASVEAERAGYGLVLASAEGDIEREASYARYFAGTQLSGIRSSMSRRATAPCPPSMARPPSPTSTFAPTHRGTSSPPTTPRKGRSSPSTRHCAGPVGSPSSAHFRRPRCARGSKA